MLKCAPSVLTWKIVELFQVTCQILIRCHIEAEKPSVTWVAAQWHQATFRPNRRQDDHSWEGELTLAAAPAHTPEPHPAPTGDIFNLIKALSSTIDFGRVVYGLHGCGSADLWWGAPISAGPHGRAASLSSLWPRAVCEGRWHIAGASLPLPIINPSLDSSLLFNLCRSQSNWPD